MVLVTHPERIVYPALGITKGDVVAYYEAMAERILPHVAGRPLTIVRYPKGIGQKGFFQKNVPPHYPASMDRIELPRREGVTTYAMLKEPDHVAFVANQGAIEQHVTCGRIPNIYAPDRVVLDLDPPEGSVALAHQAALVVREEMSRLGLVTAVVATGSKGYHVIAPIAPTCDADRIARATQELATLLVARSPDILTTEFRVANRKGRVFVDWLRNVPHATVIAPYSLRARPKASVAIPIEWDELSRTPPDAFTLRDVPALVKRSDPLLELSLHPSDPEPFVVLVGEAFRESHLVIERFDRFGRKLPTRA
jgi:bifunctional non-homologous end joining protein LigD